jgi:hypothetical protein
MSPRRNTIGHSRRRTTRRPEPEQTEVAVGWDALARELVRRGRASEAILDHPSAQHTTEEGA